MKEVELSDAGLGDGVMSVSANINSQFRNVRWLAIVSSSGLSELGSLPKRAVRSNCGREGSHSSYTRL